MSIKSDKTTTTLIVEYVWIDGNNKTRSKTRIIPGIIVPGQEENGLSFHIDLWNYDGSMTGQSENNNSDIVLVPRGIFPDPFNINTDTCKYFLCINETFTQDGLSHPTNNRSKLFTTIQNLGELVLKEQQPLFSIQQEFVILDNNRSPYGWDIGNINEFISKQGKFYCGVGSDRVFGRDIAIEHMNACIRAGIKICGVNAEVAPSQWAFQVGVCDSFQMGDHLWMARYILERITEMHGLYISYDPKPFGDRWNGSGAHTNFSTKSMRDEGGIDSITAIIGKLQGKHKEHMAVYGEGNERRMTGMYETSNFNTFTYGECDRSSSIRIPINVKKAKCGYFEDRRPACNADPYLICAIILDTVLSEN